MIGRTRRDSLINWYFALLMENVREQIFAYPQLSTEEQRAVEAYVEDHPEWAPLLRDVRQIESSFGQWPDSEPILAAYVVAQYVGVEASASSRLRETFTRLEQALEHDAELQARVDEIRGRLQRAEAELDPVSHFESLTGHTLEERSESASESSMHRRARSGSQTSESFVGRLMRKFVALPLVARGVGTVVIVLVVGYLGLFVVDQATESPLKQLAGVEVSNQMVESYYSPQTRGPRSERDTALPVDELYLRSLATLRNAESSTLGLFRQFDADSLRQAERGLQRVLNRAERHSFLALEARFYLGKTCLAQRQVDKARAHFKTIVEQEGRRAADAHRILRRLDRIALDTSAARPS